MAIGWRGQYSRYRGYFLNIMDLYKKRADLRAFLEVTLSLTTIIIFVTFALKPTILTILSLAQQIEEKEKTYAALLEKTKNLEIATNLIIQNEARIPDINIAVGTSPNPDVIAKQIQALSSKNSVELLGLSIGTATIIGEDTSAKSVSDFKPIEGAGGEMTISISIKGVYSSISAFIKDLENLRIAIKTDTLTVNASTTETGQILVGVISGRVPFTKIKSSQ